MPLTRLPDPVPTRLFVPNRVNWAAAFLLLQGMLNLGGLLLVSFDTSHLLLTIVSALVPALGFAQIAAAIGLLRLRSWARTLGVATGAIGAAEWALTLALFPLGSWITSAVAIVLLLLLYYRLLAPLLDATTAAALAKARSAQGEVQFAYFKQEDSFHRFARRCGLNVAADALPTSDKFLLKPRSTGQWRDSTFEEFKSVLAQASFWSEMASVWWVDSRVGLVSASSAPESDDWRYNVNYCFDENGHLRRLEATLVAVVSNEFAFIQSREYDVSGSMTAHEEWFEKVDSNDRLSRAPANAIEYESIAATLPLYLTDRELPFYSLLLIGGAQRYGRKP